MLSFGFLFDRFYRRQRGNIRGLGRRFARHMRNLLQLGFLRWPGYFREKAKIAKELTIDKQSPRAERLRVSRLMGRHRKMVDKANQRAMRGYRPKDFRGRVSLFIVSRPRVRRAPDRRLRWAALASDGAEVYIIPGDHHALLREPNVRILAEKLSACIRRAELDTSIQGSRSQARI